MVSGQVNNTHPDIFTNVLQGKILLNNSQLPKVIWNQIKILVISNKDGKKQKITINYFFISFI
jgi:hypothetical protein